MPMEQIVRMLEKPQRYFTAHASWYGVVQTYTVSEITPFFWEDECVMFYVRSGSGFLRVNQTLYPLSQGCFCSMHQFHVFRFEASSEEPLCMEVLIYPYPEMAYFVTSFAEDDLAFGESTVVLPACQVDRKPLSRGSPVRRRGQSADPAMHLRSAAASVWNCCLRGSAFPNAPVWSDFPLYRAAQPEGTDACLCGRVFSHFHTPAEPRIAPGLSGGV